MKILDEFKDITSIKTLELAGAYDVSLANAVGITNRDVYNGNGIITSISSNMSSAGLTTTLVLDEKCPRMFGYYRWGDEYVYCSTSGEGIHRKPLSSIVWESYSTGL